MFCLVFLRFIFLCAVCMVSLKIAFWNTGISPLHYSMPEQEKAKSVFDSVETLMRTRGIDFFVLCEVNSKTIELLNESAQGKLIVSASDNVSRNLYFDMVAIHSSRVRVISKSPMVEKVDGGNNPSIKIGYHFLLEVLGEVTSSETKLVSLIASHWASRIRDVEAYKKEHAARFLKAICDVERAKADRQLVLMGDYNDECRDNSIKNIMYSTTNRHYANGDRTILYNLSDLMSGPHIPNKTGVDYHFSGTWVSSDVEFRTGNYASCKMFDQIMVSSDMISKGPWIVNERNSGLVVSSDMKRMIVSGEIDHFPIQLNIETDR